MLGLRVQRDIDNKKFFNFFKIIQKFAEKENAVYFCDSGEGREIFTKEYEGEDLSGWLIPKELSEEFNKEYLADDISDKWDIYYRFAEWEKKDDEIIIKFVDYGIWEDLK